MRKYACTFTNVAVILIPGLAHGLHTADLSVTVYGISASRKVVIAGDVEVDDQTHDVTITLASSMSGRVVLFG